MVAAFTLLAKQRGGPKIDFQVLFYPVTDASFDTSSYMKYQEGYWLTREAMKWFWERLSKREKVLVLASFAILLLVLGHYFLIVPYLPYRKVDDLYVFHQCTVGNIRAPAYHDCFVYDKLEGNLGTRRKIVRKKPIKKSSLPE